MKVRMGVAGLDLSLNSTGIAYVNGRARRVRAGKLRGPERLVYVRGQVLDAVADADLVVIEDYIYAVAGASSLVALAELGGLIRAGLWMAGIPYLEVSPSTLKLYATGNGRADKDAMVAAARAHLGYQGDSHDEADAQWLRAVGRALVDDPLCALPAAQEAALDELRGRQPIWGSTSPLTVNVEVTGGRL